MTDKKPRKSAPHRPPAVTIEVAIDSLNEDGIGLGRHQGKEVWVAGAYPGEKVACTVSHEGHRRIAGRLRQVQLASPHRVASPCACANDCQGCPLIAMDYAEQLRLKQHRVRQALADCKLPTDILAPIWGAEQPMGYRTTAKLVFSRGRGGKVVLGLYRRGTHDVVDIGNCPLHHPLINRIAAVVREEVERQQVFLYHTERQTGVLRYLLIRVSPSRQKAMVTFVVGNRDDKRLIPLAKWLQRKLPEVISVQQNLNRSEGNVLVGRDTVRLLGAPDLLDQVDDIRLSITPAAFFQVNHTQAARIYALVRQWAALDRRQTALDLYCGIGGIALNLARDAGAVIGIEVVADAVRSAQRNAELNGLNNCRFMAGDVAELIEDVELSPGAVAVVNPPRKGCDPEVLETLAEQPIDRLIYVSCDPESLARDLALLVGRGFRLRQAQPVDMFPQTLHVETVAHCERVPS